MQQQHDGLLVEMVINGPFAENCYIVADSDSSEALLVDPGDEEQRILARVRELSLDVKQIVNTHAHIDHVGAVGPLKRLLGVPFALHAFEAPVLAHLPVSAQMFGLPAREVPEVERELADGDEIGVGSRRATILHTPGHTPGGSCIYFERERVLFAGDTLFLGSIGRSDLPGGNGPQLIDSIHSRLMTLPDDVTVYCGHGPPTTIGRERNGNPFL